jgi:cation:H+ antiporter
MIDFILLLFGVLGLWVGTELTVREASKIAKKQNWSELFIGLTILAFGTDLPELAVAIKGSLNNLKGIDSSDIIVGNALGSTICQISIVIGVTAIFHYIRVGKVQIRFIGLEIFGSILILILVGYDGIVTWNDGAIMIIAFIIYIYTNYQREKARIKLENKHPDPVQNDLFSNIIFLIAGLVVVVYSSELTLEKALGLAEMWGIRQSFIGAIIVGLGTSLPELAISILAVSKKKTELSIGNVMGSNIFDLLIPLGVGSLISKIQIAPSFLWFDIPTLILISFVVIWFLYKKRGLQRWEGFVLISLYLIYALLKYWF